MQKFFIWLSDIVAELIGAAITTFFLLLSITGVVWVVKLLASLLGVIL